MISGARYPSCHNILCKIRLFVKSSCETEITNLEITVGVQKYVRGFQVSMKNLSGVHVSCCIDICLLKLYYWCHCLTKDTPTQIYLNNARIFDTRNTECDRPIETAWNIWCDVSPSPWEVNDVNILKFRGRGRSQNFQSHASSYHAQIVRSNLISRSLHVSLRWYR